MSSFFAECGPGSNPLLSYVNRFTEDKSRWQNQFLEEEKKFRPDQFAPPGNNFGPMLPIERERQMANQFFDPREFERFDPLLPPGPQDLEGPANLPPPQVFNDFVRSFHSPEMMMSEPLGDIQLNPEEAGKIRSRADMMGRHFAVDPSVESPQVSSLFQNLNITGTNTQLEPIEVEGRNGEWAQQFSQVANQPEPEIVEMEKAWNRPAGTGQKWAEEFPNTEFEEIYGDIQNKNETWAESFRKEEEINNWKEVAHKASQINDPQIQNSQFMQFINKMASGELQVKDGALVPAKPPSMVDEFLAEGAPHSNWAEEFQEGNWAKQFESFNQGWADEFTRGDWEEQDMVNQYNEVWNKIQDSNPSRYNFQPDNRYINDPEAFTKGLALFEQGNLPEAILAFEGAVQQDPNNSLAWCKLGVAHAENDKDNLAILSLDQALTVDPNNLEALIAIAVSYTNEFQQGKAVDSIRLWLFRNPKYSHLFRDAISENPLRQVEDMLITAAKHSPTIDPDVHSALGLIYNLSFEYEKAIECFRAALTERPEDYQLWNKLGATTANSDKGRLKAPEAIDAYHRALERKPTYTRARSNLGISHMAIQEYIEAAKCFLGALEINNTVHLWDNLKSAFTMMERHDLIEKIAMAQGNVDLFRDEFDF